MANPSVLIVDDSHDMLDVLGRYLGDHGFSVQTATDGKAAINAFQAHPIDVVLTDLRMKGFDGLDVLEAIKAADPEMAVVIMTAFGNVESAVDAIQRGAFHYVTKPFKLAAVRVLLERAAQENRIRREHQHLRVAFAERFSLTGLLGNHVATLELRRIIERVADAPSAVLILGETGSGKEVVARALHLESRRRDGPFVVVNCGALPEALLESELFGHVRGAFAGATKARAGLFVEADGGTLLLDEIGDMPLALQAKLCRVLEAGEIRAVGSDVVRPVSVRCIAATHRDLDALVAAGLFRSDLFFRLAVVPIRVPPLRDRREDIPLLVGHFLSRRGASAAPGAPTRLSDTALHALEEHHWPGNVRELENVVERLVLTTAGPEIGVESVRRVLAPLPGNDSFDGLAAVGLTLEEVERRYIAAVMQRAGGSKSKAAVILNVDVSTLYRRQKGPRG
jgi:two-component system, NtrC family, response regulator HydG